MVNKELELEQNLGYTFKSKSFLDNSLRHSSFVNEQSHIEFQDNERLEFLGDAVLSLIVGHILMIRYPEIKEGDLSRMRAGLVNESCLAAIARNIELGKYIHLGKGENQTNGRRKNSILADTFEALIAAVYLDGGFDAAFKIVENHFSDSLFSISTPMAISDYKSELQEFVQEKHKITPVYKVINEKGPDHDKTFEVKIDICDICATGTGKSKKMAEQDAAKNALEILQKD